MSFGRFISALKDLVRFFISMPRSKKKAHQMTDKELMRQLFHPKVRAHVKKVARKARKKRKN